MSGSNNVPWKVMRITTEQDGREGKVVVTINHPHHGRDTLMIPASLKNVREDALAELEKVVTHALNRAFSEHREVGNNLDGTKETVREAVLDYLKKHANP